MKKLFALLCLLSLVLPPWHSAKASFTDNTDGAYDYRYNTTFYFLSADYLQEQGIVDGYSDGTFKPLNTINRAEFTKIVLNATHPEAAAGSDCFSDVSDDWFAPYVCGAQSLGIIDGYSDGSFKPSANVNFAEAAKILTNAFGMETATTEGAWYEPYVNAMNEKEYFPYSAPGVSFAVNRGEMAEMVYNFLTEDPYWGRTLSFSAPDGGDKDIVVTGAGGSCAWYQVQDLNRNPVAVSDEVEEVMTDCSLDVKFFGQNPRYLYYIKTTWDEDYSSSTGARAFKVYDFQDGSTTTLVSFYDTTENVSSVTWNEDQSRFALVVINQVAEDYPDDSKIFVLDVDGETVLNKEKYDAAVPYDCSANGPCYSLSDPEWASNTQIEFVTCEDPYSGGWGYDYPWTIDDLTTVEGCEETTLDV